MASIIDNDAAEVEIGMEEGVLASWSDCGMRVNALLLNGIPEGSESQVLAPLNPPVVIVWKDLKVSVGNSVDTPLLKNVSGVIPGGFTAIMGPSGSGKTTLMNTLACRLDRRTKAFGEIRLNGRTYSNTELKQMAGYVMQDDVLNPHLTVAETLTYAAQLRLPSSLSSAERETIVEDQLKQVGLVHCRQVVVGSALKKGISGGERKRLATAIELLTGPPLLFLDEPTSGLDSVTALSLCEMLKELGSSSKCTVVSTIHQPQSKIFYLFDHLLLLKKGHIIYQGASQNAISYFATLGFPCPPHMNPADHLMDVLSSCPDPDEVGDERSEQSIAFTEATGALKAQTAQCIDLNANADTDNTHVFDKEQDRVPWARQFAVLLERCFKEVYRKRGTWITSLVQTVVMAVFIGTVWLHIGDTTNNRTPVLFFCCINQGMVGAMNVINSFPAERVLSLRERMAGTYSVSAYFLAKNTAETLTQAPFPVVFSAIVYFLVGLKPDAGAFFIFTALMLLCANAATALALAVSALARTTDMSVAVLPMALEVARLFGSYYVPPATCPDYYRWILQLSYVSYAYTGVVLNEDENLLKGCNSATNVCALNGDSVISSLGLDYLNIEQCAGILISYIAICNFVAYLGIRFIKW